MPWEIVVPVAALVGFALLMIFVFPKLKGGG